MSDGPHSAELDEYLKRLEGVTSRPLVGRVRAVTGLAVRAAAPGARLGELVRIEGERGQLLAEVVGLQDEQVTLLPLGDTAGIGPDAEVYATGEALQIGVGEALIGRVLDGLGRAIDAGPPLSESELTPWPVHRHGPPPLTRQRIARVLPLGIRAIDGLLTVGQGQRLGIFAGAGVGKSLLVGQIARQAAADVVVIALVGERGREVRAFVEDALGPDGLARSVVVVATADDTPLMRVTGAYSATAIAEYFRDQGRSVLLMMDSLTRFARAVRDAGLAAGELPVRHGFPASVFAALPRLLERAGNGPSGSMTALYTVLVPGDDLQAPIADEVRGILDGHIVLGRRLAERGHWPAIDVLASLSRVMRRLVSPEQAAAAGELRRLLSVYEANRTLITLGAYRRGSDAGVDEAIARIDEIEGFLRQSMDEFADFDETRRSLLEVAAP